MNAAIVSQQNIEKRKSLLAHLDKMERDHETARLEVHVKDGRIVSGNLYLPILK